MHERKIDLDILIYFNDVKSHVAGTQFMKLSESNFGLIYMCTVYLVSTKNMAPAYLKSSE